MFRLVLFLTLALAACPARHSTQVQQLVKVRPSSSLFEQESQRPSMKLTSSYPSFLVAAPSYPLAGYPHGANMASISTSHMSGNGPASAGPASTMHYQMGSPAGAQTHFLNQPPAPSGAQSYTAVSNNYPTSTALPFSNQPIESPVQQKPPPLPVGQVCS